MYKKNLVLLLDLYKIINYGTTAILTKTTVCSLVYPLTFDIYLNDFLIRAMTI